MQKFARGVVRWRVVILIAAFVLLIPSWFGYVNTRINYDILYYLPDSLESVEGQDILMDDFGKGAYGIFICEDMPDKDVAALADKIRDVDHVASVVGYSEIADEVPPEMLPDSVRSVFYSDSGDATILFMFFDTSSSSDETMEAIDEIRDLAGEQCFLSSMSAVCADTKQLVDTQLVTYVSIAVILCAIVLAVTMNSFMIPVVFLVTIGMAIMYNMGTNYFKGEISYITMALAAVLQLAVTMDYSIFLYNAFREQKLRYPEDSKEAMTHAIVETIDSVSGSSLTTIAGFIALCFMSFTLGLDIGIVMAKGVLFGVLCSVTVLPAFILVCEKAIVKTSHREVKFRTVGISEWIVKHRKVLLICISLLWIPAIYGYQHINVYYKLDSSLPDYLSSVQANEKLSEDFDMKTVSLILVSDDMTHQEDVDMLAEIEQVDGVNFAFGLDSLTGSGVPDEFIPAELRDSLESDDYKLVLVSSDYEVATDEVNAQCDEINSIIKSYDENSLLIGEAAGTKDLIDVTNHDFAVVSSVSIIIVFALILLVLQSWSLPVFLILIIELAIYINLSIAYYTNVTLPFIASIFVSVIQLGSTVDYAILMTTQYKHRRLIGKDRHESVVFALAQSMYSIFTSALGFFAATFGVALYSDIDLISSMCMLLGRGALISMLVVIFVLPSVLYIFDPLICRTTRHMRALIRKKQEVTQE